MPETLYTTKEVAEMFKVNEVTVYRWVRSGELTAIRLPRGCYRISADELKKFIAERTGKVDERS